MLIPSLIFAIVFLYLAGMLCFRVLISEDIHRENRLRMWWLMLLFWWAVLVYYMVDKAIDRVNSEIEHTEK